MSSQETTTARRAAAILSGEGSAERETVFRRLDARMGEIALRGHIYLTEHVVVEFATRETRSDRPLDRNVGPEPVRRALGEILRPAQEAERWLRRLHAEVASGTRVPAPALWNTPALVVTGAMASRALCAALEHQADYPTRTIEDLMQEGNVDENEAAAMFEDVTGKPPPRPREDR